VLNNLTISYTPQSAGTLSELYADTDALGQASVYFTVTKQPGDNFAVAVSTDQSYINGLTVDGRALRDSLGVALPTAQAKRTDMLTVWRRVHFEVDSMDTVKGSTPDFFSEDNFSAGYIRTRTTVGTEPVWINISPTNGALDPEKYSSTFDLIPGTPFRKYGGRMVVGGVTLQVLNNTTNSVKVKSDGLPVTLRLNQIYTLYDDDDYNSSDGAAWDGDIGEDVRELSDTFSLMMPEDYITTNLLAAAYIQPQYNWAANRGYNQSNVDFRLNVDIDLGVTYFTTTYNNSYNGIGQPEIRSEDFWIAYLNICYQGNETADFDNYIETGLGGVVPNSSVINDVPSNPNQISQGGDGALIFIETMRDADDVVFEGQVRRTREWVAIHEMGHQLGLAGDNMKQNFGIMNPPRMPLDAMQFVPRHINVLRWRKFSPGQYNPNFGQP
jgi:hypothetical protein